MKRNRRILGLVAALAGVAVLLAGVAVASNMGFKFVPVIPGLASGKAFNLSLPWNNNFTQAADLFIAIDAYNPGKLSAVQKFNTNSTLSGWVGGSGTNFAIDKGQAYIIIGGQGSDINPVIVGSHDPNFTYSFPVGALNAAAPYHQTYTDAASLFSAIQATCGASLQAVQKFTAQSTLAGWVGGAGANFPLDLGMGVIVKVGAPCSGFVWAHY